MSVQWPAHSHDGSEVVSSGSSSPDDHLHPPRTPTTSNVDAPLLPPESPPPKPPARSFSTSSNFVSSPLNPNAPHTIRSRPASRGSTYFNRIASEESQALTSFANLHPGQRGSMVLYRLAGDDHGEYLLPPKALANRDSVASSSGDSIFSLSSDSKYPSGMPSRGAFVPYAYDPDTDLKDEGDEEDPLHTGDPDDKRGTFCSIRGFLNVGVLVILILALLTLFVCYPVLNFYTNLPRNTAIDGNVRINATGQNPVL